MIYIGIPCVYGQIYGKPVLLDEKDVFDYFDNVGFIYSINLKTHVIEEITYFSI